MSRPKRFWRPCMTFHPERRLLAMAESLAGNSLRAERTLWRSSQCPRAARHDRCDLRIRGRGTMNIGLLEPTPLVRDCVVTFLSANGFAVTLACSSTNEFLGQLSVQSVDVAIAAAPPSDMIPFVSQMRQWHPDVPLVVLGDGDDVQHADRYLEEGAAAFLSKRTAHSPELIA